MNEKNYSMLCDFYSLTMANAYLRHGKENEIAYFDLFFRTVPDGGGFVIAAGLKQLVDYIKNLRFTEDEIAYLRGKRIFDEEFLEYLRQFRFSGDITAVPEGTPVFPNEPILTVRAPVIEAQLIETYVLLCINHQSLIATKANRIVRAAKGKIVLELGARRAQGADGAVIGARAAYIGGVNATSCVMSERDYKIPACGTMSHAWVQMFDSEYEAFAAFCRQYPANSALLVDTYNVLESGVPNAIRAFKEILLPRGITDFAIRLDSGDLAYLSAKAREMLDGAGLTSCKIVASNSLDEMIIQDLERQNAKIDVYGVGERLITSKSSPVLGGVYKLVAVERDGKITPKIKISENVSKITTPHYKKIFRLYRRRTGEAIADWLCLYDEEIDDGKPLEIFDPQNPWKRKVVTDFTARSLHIPVLKKGECVNALPPVEEIRSYCAQQVETLWDEVKRFENPHRYYVDLSQKLWEVKQNMLKK